VHYVSPVTGPRIMAHAWLPSFATASLGAKLRNSDTTSRDDSTSTERNIAIETV
jgi:hypothetical protein